MVALELITNSNCNLDCYFCFAHHKEKTFLTLNEMKKAIDLITDFADKKKEKEIFIKIYGGEPLLYYENISKLLYYIETKSENYSFEVAIITNGTIMPDSFLEVVKKIIKNNKYFLDFTFSLEGSEKLHNKIRHYKNSDIGSFDIMFDNMKKLREKLSWKRNHVQTVLSPDLLNNINDYISFMEKNKDCIHFDLVPMFDTTFQNQDKKILNNMDILFNYYIKKIKEKDCDHIGIFQSQRSLCNLFNKSEKHHCSAGFEMVCVMSNGDVIPCSKFYHNDLNLDENSKYSKIYYNFALYGNIKNNSNKEIIDQIILKMNNFKDITKHNAACIECQNKNKFGCTGSCIVENIQNNLTPYKYVCDYNIKFGQLSKKLKDECYSEDEFIKKFEYYQTNKYTDFHNKFINFLRRK